MDSYRERHRCWPSRKTYFQQLGADMECHLEDSLRPMTNRDGWRRKKKIERERERETIRLRENQFNSLCNHSLLIIMISLFMYIYIYMSVYIYIYIYIYIPVVEFRLCILWLLVRCLEVENKVCTVNETQWGRNSCSVFRMSHVGYCRMFKSS